MTRQSPLLMFENLNVEISDLHAPLSFGFCFDILSIVPGSVGWVRA